MRKKSLSIRVARSNDCLRRGGARERERERERSYPKVRARPRGSGRSFNSNLPFRDCSESCIFLSRTNVYHSITNRENFCASRCAGPALPAGRPTCARLSPRAHVRLSVRAKARREEIAHRSGGPFIRQFSRRPYLPETTPARTRAPTPHSTY